LPPDACEVLIVGAGFAGLGMGIQLAKAGLDSFLIIEKAGDLGGTWRDNRYPGCACDIPSHLYSFSFDLNPNWSRMYAPQEEIWEYLRDCAKRYAVLSHIRFGAKLEEAAWDDGDSVWRVRTSDGRQLQARVLISGMGALHAPAYPRIAGMDRFAGPAFHSAAWDTDMTLAGRHIAVIGTGASAIQFVPQIAAEAGRLYLFQRTPPWILPKTDSAIPPRWRNRFRRVPSLMRLYREWLFWNLEMRVPGFLGAGRIALWERRLGEKMARRHLESQVADPALRRALTPDYELGCKRVLVSSDFYPALARPNVELVTAPIREIREHSIVTTDETERMVDVLIYATGFRATDLLHGTSIRGRGGRDFQEAWDDFRCALWGVTMHDFPNLFLLLGPNTGLGHNSVVLMIEAQIQYVMSCLKLMRDRGFAAMEPRAEVQRKFGELLHRRLRSTVWQAGGCRSWYQDAETGENPAMWPGSVVAYQRRTRKVCTSDYEMMPEANSLRARSRLQSQS
jgi:cation diffusion facilitator CzcD-associated flavoprotein CzcO